METTELSEKSKFNWQRMLITIGIVVVTAVVFAGGVWYVMDRQAKKDREGARKTAQDLQQQIDDLKKTQASTDTTATDPTVNWKTYNNTMPSFSFKYPTNQVATPAVANDPSVWLSSDGTRPNTTLSIYYQKNSATTALGYFNYVKDNIGLPEPYSIIGAKIISGATYYQVNFTHMGQPVTGLYYAKGGYGYQVSYPTPQTTLYEQIVSTLTIN